MCIRDSGLGGKIHASLARPITRLIDTIAYNGDDSKSQDYSKADLVINNFENIYIEKLKTIKSN